MWSCVWSLTGSSASSLQDALSGNGTSAGGSVAKLSGLLVAFGVMVLVSRYAKTQLEPPASPLLRVIPQRWRPRSPDLSAVRRFPRVASAPDVCGPAETAKTK